MGRAVFTVLLLAVLGGLGWLVQARLHDMARPSDARGAAPPVPVEVAAIERGPIEQRRTFSGTLDPRAEFVVAPKVSGRVERLTVDLADTVTRGAVVAKLDDDEYVQSVAQAEADFEVAKANLAESQSLLGIAARELRRNEELRERGVTSESQLDIAKGNQLTRRAHVEVTRAQVTRAEAALEAARIRLGYTEVAAGWRGGNDQRLVAERYVDEGETVTANQPLLRIVEIDPITAVFSVTERDYARLQSGQPVALRTDAHPGEVFEGRIARIAPVFSESTRQARVEVAVKNPGLRLKPGTFVRVTVVLDRVEDAIIVPEQALVRRDGRDGVFVVTGDRRTVAWREVEVGIREEARVQITAETLGEAVVTLGQQLLDDGSSVSVASHMHDPAP